MKCPNCGLINPESALRCDCGYDFPSGTMKESYLTRGISSEISSNEESEVEATAGCKNCGSNATEPQYSFQLCADCRNNLANRSFPAWATATFAVVVALLFFSLTQFPGSLKAGIAFKRGQRAESAHDYSKAVTEYQTVAERFPDLRLHKRDWGSSIIDQVDTPKPRPRSKDLQVGRQQVS